MQVSDSVQPFLSRLHHYVINNLNFHDIDFDSFADQSVKYNVKCNKLVSGFVINEYVNIHNLVIFLCSTYW